MNTKKSLLLVAMSLGFGVVQLDVSVVNVAVQSINTSLGGGITALQWVVNAYTLAFASLILTAGSLGDRIGAKKLYVTGFSLFTAASLACGFSSNIFVLIAARTLQGVGAAILVPCSLALLNHSYTNTAERRKAVGLWAAGASIALAGGPLIGGLLIAVLSWRAIFFINVPLGLIGILLTVFYARETPKSNVGGLDILGQLSAVACLAFLATAIIYGGTYGFFNIWVVAGYIGAIGAGIIFIIRERTTPHPMLSLALFQSPRYRAMSSIGLLVNIAFYGFIFVLSLFLQNEQHLTPLQTGLAFAPMTAVIFFANIYASRLEARLGESRAIMGAAVLLITGCLGLLGIDPHSSYVSIALQLLAIGTGLGLIVPIITAGQLSSVVRSMSGIASGTLNTARQVGSVMGVSLYGSLAARSLANGLKEALIFSAVIAGCIIFVTLTIRAPMDHTVIAEK